MEDPSKEIRVCLNGLMNSETYPIGNSDLTSLFVNLFAGSSHVTTVTLHSEIWQIHCSLACRGSHSAVSVSFFDLRVVSISLPF